MSALICGKKNFTNIPYHNRSLLSEKLLSSSFFDFHFFLK